MCDLQLALSHIKPTLSLSLSLPLSLSPYLSFFLSDSLSPSVSLSLTFENICQRTRGNVLQCVDYVPYVLALRVL